MSIWPFSKKAESSAAGRKRWADISSLEKESRVPELDGIRGIAILMVVCCHYLEISPDAGYGAKTAGAVLATFWTGVDLFFVLSGYLIGGILIDHWGSASYFRTFYIRRVCRIFPLYFLWLSLYYVLTALLPRNFPGYSAVFGWDLFHFPKWGYAFFLQNFYTAATGDFGPIWMSPTWSLAVEEQFYLFLPVVIWVMLRRKLPRVLIVLIILVPLLRVFLFLFRPSLFIYVLFPCRADALLLGVLCAYALRQKRSRDWFMQNRKILYAVFFCLLAGMFYIVSLSYGYSPLRTQESLEMASFGFTLVALFFASLLLIAVTDRDGFIGRILRFPFFRNCGILAYGIFISHDAIRGVMLELVFGPNEGSVLLRNLVCAVAFLVTWFLASLSWQYFEKPIVHWGHSFRYATSKNTSENVSIPMRSA